MGSRLCKPMTLLVLRSPDALGNGDELSSGIPGGSGLIQRILLG